MAFGKGKKKIKCIYEACVSMHAGFGSTAMVSEHCTVVYRKEKWKKEKSPWACSPTFARGFV